MVKLSCRKGSTNPMKSSWLICAKKTAKSKNENESVRRRWIVSELIERSTGATVTRRRPIERIPVITLARPVAAGVAQQRENPIELDLENEIRITVSIDLTANVRLTETIAKATAIIEKVTVTIARAIATTVKVTKTIATVIAIIATVIATTVTVMTAIGAAIEVKNVPIPIERNYPNHVMIGPTHVTARALKIDKLKTVTGKIHVIAIVASLSIDRAKGQVIVREAIEESRLKHAFHHTARAQIHLHHDERAASHVTASVLTNAAVGAAATERIRVNVIVNMIEEDARKREVKSHVITIAAAVVIAMIVTDRIVTIGRAMHATRETRRETTAIGTMRHVTAIAMIATETQGATGKSKIVIEIVTRVLNLAKRREMCETQREKRTIVREITVSLRETAGEETGRAIVIAGQTVARAGTLVQIETHR